MEASIAAATGYYADTNSFVPDDNEAFGAAELNCDHHKRTCSFLRPLVTLQRIDVVNDVRGLNEGTNLIELFMQQNSWSLLKWQLKQFLSALQ